jgi:ERAP1-like C-terminal domain
MYEEPQSGQAPIGDYLNLVQAIDLNENANIAGRVTRDLSRLDDRLVTDATRPAFQRRVQQLLRPYAAKLGWQAAANEDDERRRLRTAILQALGTTGGDPEVISEALRRTGRYLEDPTSLDSTLAEGVLSIAAWNGDAALFDKLAAKAKAAKTHDELFRYLGALSKFRDPALIQRALEIPKDAANSLRGALEQIDYCIDFRLTQREALEAWAVGSDRGK